MMILLLHELAEIDRLVAACAWIGAAATPSYWLVYLLIVKIAEALLPEIGSVHICAGAERHHQTLNVRLANSIFLLHFLQELVVFRLLLEESDPLLIIRLPAL